MKKIYFSDKMFYGGHMYTITSYPHNEAEACKVDMSDFLEELIDEALKKK